MTLAKSSLGSRAQYLALVPTTPSPTASSRAIEAEHARTVAAVLEIVESDALLDRHPVLQRSVALRNPYVDPMNAHPGRAAAPLPRAATRRRSRPLLRSIAGIAAALRNTG